MPNLKARECANGTVGSMWPCSEVLLAVPGSTRTIDVVSCTADRCALRFVHRMDFCVQKPVSVLSRITWSGYRSLRGPIGPWCSFVVSLVDMPNLKARECANGTVGSMWPCSEVLLAVPGSTRTIDVVSCTADRCALRFVHRMDFCVEKPVECVELCYMVRLYVIAVFCGDVYCMVRIHVIARSGRAVVLFCGESS